MAQNDQDGLNAVFEASEFLANLLARYANIEANYRKRPCTDSDQLERSIVDVYVAVLLYSAAVKAAHRRSTLGMGISHNSIRSFAYFLLERVKESFLSLTEQPLQTLKDEIHTADNEVNQWKDLIKNECK